MTPVQAILVVIIRLWAAGYIITYLLSLPSVSTIFHNLFSSDGDLWTILTILNYLVMVFVAVIAWVLAPWLARRVHSDVGDAKISMNIDANMLVMTGSFLIGCFYLAAHVPPLLVDLAIVLVQLGQQNPDASHTAGQLKFRHFGYDSFIKHLLVVIAALWMAFRPQHMARIFSWLRGAGLSPRDFEAGQTPSEKGK